MTCTQIEPLLNALADRELSPWQTWRIHRHVAACPACAAQLAAIDRLDTTVRAGQDVPVPSALGTRIAATLPPAPILSPRRAFPVRPAAVGLTGLAAALGAFFWFLPGQPGQPTIAYADVVKAMASVKTAAWTQELTLYDAGGMLKVHQVQQVWVRRNPAAIFIITLPDASHPQQRQLLEDARGRLALRPNGKYILEANKCDVLSDVQRSLAAFGAALSPTTRSGMGSNSAAVMRTMLYGQSVLRYTQMFHCSLSPQVLTETRTSLWLDPATKRCLKMESQTKHNGTPWVNTAIDHVQYDRTPPPGVFDWPPNGAEVRKG